MSRTFNVRGNPLKVTKLPLTALTHVRHEIGGSRSLAVWTGVPLSGMRRDASYCPKDAKRPRHGSYPEGIRMRPTGLSQTQFRHTESFCRAYATSVVAVKPLRDLPKVFRKSNTSLAYISKGWWYLVDKPSLKLARYLVSLGLKAPGRIKSALGLTVKQLSECPPIEFNSIFTNADFIFRRKNEVETFARFPSGRPQMFWKSRKFLLSELPDVQFRLDRNRRRGEFPAGDERGVVTTPPSGYVPQPFSNVRRAFKA